MVIAIGKYIGSMGEFYHKIPAYVENGILVLGHNGCSLENGNYLDSPENIRRRILSILQNILIEVEVSQPLIIYIKGKFHMK